MKNVGRYRTSLRSRSWRKGLSRNTEGNASITCERRPYRSLITCSTRELAVGTVLPSPAATTYDTFSMKVDLPSHLSPMGVLLPNALVPHGIRDRSNACRRPRALEADRRRGQTRLPGNPLNQASSGKTGSYLAEINLRLNRSASHRSGRTRACRHFTASFLRGGQLALRGTATGLGTQSRSIARR